MGHPEIWQGVQKGESQAVTVTNYHDIRNYHDVFSCSAVSHTGWKFPSHPSYPVCKLAQGHTCLHLFLMALPEIGMSLFIYDCRVTQHH